MMSPLRGWSSQDLTFEKLRTLQKLESLVARRNDRITGSAGLTGQEKTGFEQEVAEIVC
jgi:hypothetical protein